MSAWPVIWTARWIWAGLPPVEARPPVFGVGAPPDATHNRFALLRTSFTLDDLPLRVPARVTADSRFVLFVNGEEVARGPARSVPERLAFAETDLAPALVEGENVVAAIVRFYGQAVAWWRPAQPSGLVGYGSFAMEAPSIGVATDGTWRGLAGPWRQATRGNPPTEIVDGAKMPRGWMLAGFDDSKWAEATELAAGGLAAAPDRIPCEPFTLPEPEGIAPLTSIPVPLAPIGHASFPRSDEDDPVPADRAVRRDAAPDGDRYTTYDAGRITLATPWLEVRGPRGATVDVYAGEDLRSNGTVEIRPRRYALRYSLAGEGVERVESFEAVGFRYAGVSAQSGVEVVAVGATERRYPRGDEARFWCDDDRLNAIWAMGARTLDVCSTDAFLDCPGREQRAWVGDSYIHALLTYVTSTDWRLVRRHLRLCSHSVRPDGLLTMSAAGDLSLSSTTIPDYSLHWIRALARYWEHAGDEATVRELLPTGAGVVRALEGYRAPDGLLRGVPGWVFIDWAMTQRAEVTGALDALYAAALDDYAGLLDAIVDDSRGAAAARSCAARTREGFELLWDATRGVYVDAADVDGPLRRVSQQTNAAAIVGRCAPPERWGRMLDATLDPARVVVTPVNRQWGSPSDFVEFDERTSVVAAQPFFSHIVHQAVVDAGRRDLINDLCLRWWAQIERGNTTFEEYWDAPPGTASRAHAWSGTPTYDLTTHVLGVRPLQPGYVRAAVRPHLGSLRRAAGRVPTPHGLIEVELQRDRARVVVPDGVTVQLDLESGVSRELGPGEHNVGS